MGILIAIASTLLILLIVAGLVTPAKQGVLPQYLLEHAKRSQKWAGLSLALFVTITLLIFFEVITFKQYLAGLVIFLCGGVFMAIKNTSLKRRLIVVYRRPNRSKLTDFINFKPYKSQRKDKVLWHLGPLKSTRGRKSMSYADLADNLKVAQKIKQSIDNGVNVQVACNNGMMSKSTYYELEKRLTTNVAKVKKADQYMAEGLTQAKALKLAKIIEPDYQFWKTYCPKD